MDFIFKIDAESLAALMFLLISLTLAFYAVLWRLLRRDKLVLVFLLANISNSLFALLIVFIVHGIHLFDDKTHTVLHASIAAGGILILASNAYVIYQYSSLYKESPHE